MKRAIQTILVLLALTGCGLFQRTAKAPRYVTILAVNDMHAELDNFPRFAFIIDSLRGLYPELILVSAGDNQTGNPINDMYQPTGWPMIALMNEVGFDLSAVGNHEFDSNVTGFEYLTQHAQFSFLCANFEKPSGSTLDTRPVYYITLKDGTRVAFVSLLEVSKKSGWPSSHPDKVRPYTFHQPLTVVDRLDAVADSADLAVYINHIGYEEDQALAAMLDARRFPLIIGGHTHTLVPDGTVVNGVHITQAKSNLAFSTLIRVQINQDGTKQVTSKNIPVGKEGNVDPDVAHIVQQFASSPALQKTVVYNSHNLQNKAQIGYMLMDGLREVCETDFAIINGGGIRVQEWPKGDVSVMQIYKTDPFGNEALIYQLTGQQILDLVKAHCVGDKHKICYPSGLRIVYRMMPDGSCDKIQLTLPNGEPFDLDRTYTVALNSYLSSAFLPEDIVPLRSMHMMTAELTVQYLSSIKEIPDYRKEKRVEIY